MHQSARRGYSWPPQSVGKQRPRRRVRVVLSAYIVHFVCRERYTCVKESSSNRVSNTHASNLKKKKNLISACLDLKADLFLHSRAYFSPFESFPSLPLEMVRIYTLFVGFRLDELLSKSRVSRENTYVSFFYTNRRTRRSWEIFNLRIENQFEKYIQHDDIISYRCIYFSRIKRDFNRLFSSILYTPLKHKFSRFLSLC